MKNETNHAQEQAAAQLRSVAAMVAALNCDYDRLDELREEYDELAKMVADAETPAETQQAAADLAEWEAENLEEFQELEAQAGDCTNREEAEQVILEDALSVEVRSDWVSQGDEMEAGEFRIVLCTGGPHVEIVGELNQGEPSRARLLYQDWFTGKTEFITDSEGDDALNTYVACFYFGE